MGSGGAPMGLGTLRVSGYVRGCPLQVDRLVHISGFGDFQLSQIDAPIDPLPLNSMTARPAKPGKEGDVGMQDGGVDEVASVRVLMKADPARRESLQAEAEVDPMDGEQTWSSDTELLEAEEARKSKRVMKVPKGTSDYQATWIVDEEDEVSTDDEEDDAMMDESIDGEDLDSQVDAASGCGSNEYEDDEDEEELNSTSDKGGSDQRYDEHMDEAEEGEGLKRYREARANEMFPDEVDTPLDQSAKNRFQRYRGLKSFRSSPWDPMENLPADYSHIFQFQSFERTRRRILAEAAQEEEGAWWAANKHKLERFLRVDAPTVVSVYAPITFPTAGVLLFRQREDGMQDLVGTGSLLSCDPQHVVLKRIVLSGHPFKINRRSAVCRYMFFNRDDILWFKPVELRTKWGRRGHIKEALGTHGHMKCVFDSQMRSQDTVMMNLYKRIYPRWTYDPYVPLPLPWVKGEGTRVPDDFDME
ncbi:unnamed protein product [Coregonus sp. 'balchen']|nr:unnamed protein product [Coregonus sp. 'balchen']